MKPTFAFTVLLLVTSCAQHEEVEACFYRYEISREDYAIRGVPDVIGEFFDDRFEEYVSGDSWPPIGRNGTMLYEDICGQTEFDPAIVSELRKLGAELYFEPISDHEYFSAYEKNLRDHKN